MSYAIYALSWKKQELHHEFVSRKKDAFHVWGDVIAFITEYNRGLETDRAGDLPALQKQHDDLNAFILEELPNWTLVTLELMDKDTEERLDEMFEFLDRHRRYCDEFAFVDNREALVLMSRLDFGLRRLIDRRFNHLWLEGPQEIRDQQQAEFIWYSNQLRTFNALVTSSVDMDRFNQLTEAWSGPESILKDPAHAVDADPAGEYIWWTNQGDCEGVIAYHEKARFEGMIPWGGPLRDHVFSELRSRHGRHARGSVWGLKDQPKFDEKNDFHRYIIKYCGGVLITYEDLMSVRHNQGFVTDLKLKPLWELK
ncbi:hypothetical protein D3C87_598550 [compost metagenome]